MALPRILLRGPPPGNFLRDVLIPDLSNPGLFHPHKTDFYVPTAVPFSTCIVCLHGGSETKEQFARNLGVAFSNPATTDTVRWSLLNNYHVMAVFPQGQACTGTVGPFNPNGADTRNAQFPKGVFTWSNGEMWSQTGSVNAAGEVVGPQMGDQAYLNDLSAYITAQYGVIGRNLAGHSEGGFMTKYMWYTQFGPWQRHLASSGPPAISLLGAAPVVPPGHTPKPIFDQFGQLDNLLDITGGPAGPGDHFFDQTWEQALAHISKADVAYPAPNFAVSGWTHLQQATTAFGGGTISPSDGVVTSITIGTMKTWTYGAGAVVCQLLSAAGHQVTSHQNCTGHLLIQDWFNFIQNT